MKGQISLHTQFFSGNESSTVETKQRPRNFFMPERNELLVYRYYFYAQIKGYRYEKCLEELEQDVFITGFRQIAVLSSCVDLLSDVMKNKPTVKELARKFPRFNWNL